MAYDPDDREIYFPDVIAISDGIMKPLRLCKDGNRAYKRHPLMQFTGHLDINDVQIFEHHICRMVWACGTVSVDKIVKKVDYFAPEYSTQPISTLKSIGVTFEVIGNIFDNPELVTKYELMNDNE